MHSPFGLTFPRSGRLNTLFKKTSPIHRPYAARPAVAISDPYFLARVELIYLDHVEWYLVGERVLRQFGIGQPVPDPPPRSFHASRTGGAALSISYIPVVIREGIHE
ncbi:hypothetical protein QYF36_007775 [Acer negundo]|nr:hypothetical protein QYF36_007775 [Acer negundo]